MRPLQLLTMALTLVAIPTLAPSSRAEWKPAKAPLMTRWAADVDPAKPHPDYPRPQLVRDRWLNLNGLWDYAIRPREERRPDSFEAEILVPFPVESALSGVMKRVSPDQTLWYRRTFTKPADWAGGRVLLHFGAVDWEARVLINGQFAGAHRGGYDPFSIEVTDLLKDGENELVVRVWDPSDKGYQPRGKQVLEPKGIWYTPVTGIWQTVWLEPVAEDYIRALRIVTKVAPTASISVTADASIEGTLMVQVLDEGKVVASGKGPSGGTITTKVEDPKLWSPDSPYLYDLKIGLIRDGQQVDEVRSYVGLRSIEVKKDNQGANRLFLNNKPLFQFGPLDQGWWPDGLYTAPTDEALKYDVEITKALGFNMTRKHVKVEPARWYYWCDKLGLLVWQDMPSGDAHPKWIREVDVKGPELRRGAESADDFRIELEELVVDFFNHPSIVAWVPFNERWGQFDTADAVARIRRLDSTRPINAASGGNFHGVGDILDVHSYPDPSMPRLDPNMAVVCGEFGGLGLPLESHTWLDKGNWGYKTFDNPQALTEAYLSKIAMLRPMIEKGLAAAIYTQITDVEIEVNGLLTYDRSVLKMDQDTVAEANRQLYQIPNTPAN